MPTGEAFSSFCYYSLVSSTVHSWIGMTIWKTTPEKIWTWPACKEIFTTSSYDSMNGKQLISFFLPTVNLIISVTNPLIPKASVNASMD